MADVRAAIEARRTAADEELKMNEALYQQTQQALARLEAVMRQLQGQMMAFDGLLQDGTLWTDAPPEPPAPPAAPVAPEGGDPSA